MVSADGLRFIWLDQHIGRDGEYEAFKSKCQNTLEEAAAIPPDAINVLIWAMEQNVAPFLFAHTPAQAATLIEAHNDKQIIFISSGSLGQYMIPFISAFYTHVYKFFIFCGNIENYVKFGSNYRSCLQIFNHEADLLVRLARDISEDIIKQGELYMAVDDPENALKCFEHSLTLNVRANQMSNREDHCFIYLKQLNGHGNSIGLIQQAKNMLNQGQQQSEETDE
jgi:hypothetical protein